MGKRGWLLAALAALGIAAIVAAVLPDRDGEPRAEEASPASAPPTRGPDRLLEGDANGPEQADAAGTDSDADSADGGASGSRSPLQAKRRDALLEGITKLGAALSVEREVEETESEEEEKIREAAWSRMIDELAGMVRSDPQLADEMLAQMDALEDEAHAVRLARILRRANHPELLQAMHARVTGGDTPMKRRTAMLILESRDQEHWLEPVSGAYRKDADDSVRDEAAGVLSRSLADRKHIEVHTAMRDTIQSGLDAPEPAERVRALKAMLGDRRPGPSDLERAKALLDDDDEGVKQAAARTVRVLGPLVERALKRRNER